MRSKLKWVFIVFVFLLALNTAFAACNINVSDLVTGVRIDSTRDSSFSSEINAEPNKYIDVRLSFDLDNYSSSCSSIKAKIKISRYDESRAEWVEYRTNEKSVSSSDGSKEVIFENIFSTGSSSNYSKFMIEGMIFEGTKMLDSSDAFVNLMSGSCDGIKLDTTNILH